MSIYHVPKINGWEKIVLDLKSAGGFGIHGAKNRNVEAIIKEGGLWGHYFAVGDEEKRLDDLRFYEHLWASASVALGLSQKYDVISGKVEFDGLPSLIIGIENQACRERGFHLIHGEAHALSSIWIDASGNILETFGIGHEFSKEFIDTFALVTSEKDIEQICSASEKEVQGKAMYGKDITLSYLVGRELTKTMLRKVYRAIKEYELNNQ